MSPIVLKCIANVQGPVKKKRKVKIAAFLYSGSVFRITFSAKKQITAAVNKKDTDQKIDTFVVFAVSKNKLNIAPCRILEQKPILKSTTKKLYVESSIFHILQSPGMIVRYRIKKAKKHRA